VELLKTVAPQTTRVAALLYRKEPTSESRWNEIKRAVAELRTEAVAVEVLSPAEIDDAFAMIMREHANALIVLTTTFFIQEKGRIADLAAGHSLPAVYEFPVFVRSGGLMSYGADNLYLFRRAAAYVNKMGETQ